jgi:hypothetical protein
MFQSEVGNGPQDVDAMVIDLGRAAKQDLSSRAFVRLKFEDAETKYLDVAICCGVPPAGEQIKIGDEIFIVPSGFDWEVDGARLVQCIRLRRP